MNADIEKIYELLDCPICYEKLDHFNKVLPCQHTFCSICLQKIVSNIDNELPCPECRFIYKGKIDDLPSNVFLIRILNKCEEMKTLSDPSVNEKNTVMTINKGEHLQVIRGQSAVSSSTHCYSRPVLKATRQLTHSNISTSRHIERPTLKATRRYSSKIVYNRL